MNLKTTKIIYWVATIAIFLFEGVMPALFSQKKESLDSITHLGYPIYFSVVLTVFKVLGALILLIPKVPPRAKEWAYAGFTFDFLFAAASHYYIDGFGFFAIFPFIVLAVLMVSYVCYHKLLKANA